MPGTILRDVASGSTATFAVSFPYLDRAHVEVRLDDILLSSADYSWPDDGNITLLAGNPSAGTVVERKRVTPAEPLTVFSPGNFSTDDLNVGITQPLYLAEEGSDAAEDSNDRAWYTANLGGGGLITKGADGELAKFDGDGNIEAGPSVAGIEAMIEAVEGAMDAAQALLNGALGTTIHNATEKTTVADDDEVAIADSAASYGLKRRKASTVWTWILGKFNAVSDSTPLDADRVWYGDSTSSWRPLYATWTNIKAFLKTYFDTLYQPLAAPLTALAAIGTAVAGDVIYASAAGVWSRLAKGSAAGMAFVMNSAGTFPEWAHPASKVVASGTVSAQAQLDLVLSTYLAQGYRDFELVIQNYVPSTDNTFLRLTISTNAGSSFIATAYRWAYQHFNTSGAGYSGSNSDTSALLSAENGNAANEALSGYLKFRCGASRFTYEFVAESLDQLATQGSTRTGGSRSSADVNAIRLASSSGNISLDYTLRAIKSS